MSAAAWSPSLDELLTTTPPPKVTPFDLDHHLNVVQRACGEGLHAQDRHHSRGLIFRHVTDLTADRDRARDIACSLEGELAHLTARVAEAVRWLELAASHSVSEDCDAAIDDAMAALRGEPT